MQVFKDREFGHEWHVRLDFDKVKEIFERCERSDSTPENRKTFDLLRVFDDDLPSHLQFYQQDNATGYEYDLNKMAALVNMFYVICEKECKERNISDEEFGRLLVGTTFDLAYHAFQEELINFFPERAKREAVKKLITLVETLQAAAVDQLVQLLTQQETALVAQTMDASTKITNSLRLDLMSKGIPVGAGTLTKSSN